MRDPLYKLLNYSSVIWVAYLDFSWDLQWLTALNTFYAHFPQRYTINSMFTIPGIKLWNLPFQMMACCKQNNQSELLNEDSGDEGNFVKQPKIKQKPSVGSKVGFQNDAWFMRVLTNQAARWSIWKPFSVIETLAESTVDRQSRAQLQTPKN